MQRAPINALGTLEERGDLQLIECNV